MKQPFLIAVSISVISFLLATQVFAEPVSFDTLLGKALEKSPELAVLRAKVERERAEAARLGNLSNPEISAEIRPFVSATEGKDTEYEISLAQPLQLSSFGKRQKLSSLLHQLADWELELTLNEFTQNLSLSYGKAWVLQERKELLSVSMSEISRLTEQVKKGAEGGAFRKSLTDLFKADKAIFEGKSFALDADRRKAIAEISRKVGEPVDGVVLRLVLSSIPTDFAENERIPAVDRIRLRGKVALQQRSLSRLDSAPTFSPKIGFEHTDDGDDRIIVGLTTNLPIFDRNQSGRAEASADYLARRAEEQYVESGGFKKELDLLLRSARESETLVGKYENEIIPALKAALKSAKEEVSAGQGDAFQLREVITEIAEAQDRYLESYIKLLSERAELSILAGKIL